MRHPGRHVGWFFGRLWEGLKDPRGNSMPIPRSRPVPATLDGRRGAGPHPLAGYRHHDAPRLLPPALEDVGGPLLDRDWAGAGVHDADLGRDVGSPMPLGRSAVASSRHDMALEVELAEIRVQSPGGSRAASTSDRHDRTMEVALARWDSEGGHVGLADPR